MMKTQIGLGVLSIPVAFDSLGIVPGVIVLIVIAAITTWSDYIIGVFKLKHREVYGIDDVGELLLGPIGRILLGGAFVLCKLYPTNLPINTRTNPQQGGSSSLARECWEFPSASMLSPTTPFAQPSTLPLLRLWHVSSVVSKHWAVSPGSLGSVLSLF